MNRINKIFALIHIPLWVLFCMLIVIQVGSSDEPNWIMTAIGVILSCVYVFYSHFFILTRFYIKKMWSAYFLILACIILTGPLPFLIFHYENMSGPNTLTDLYFITMISVLPLFLFLSGLARVTHNLIINTIKKEELEKQAVQAELYYLKSQINPHFLFNTLNNIHTLVYKQAPEAPEAVMRLSSLMRYMIYESNATVVPLSREMNYLQDYISLQQLRYQIAPVVDLKITGDTDTCYIAPLLFIHFLENAYKHSPAHLGPGAIKVCVEIKENTLTFNIQNHINKNKGILLEELGGIGLPNIQKRLTLLYPGQHNLEIDNSGEIFSVTLKIFDLHLHAHERKANLLYN